MKINPKNSPGCIRISEARRAKERFSHAIFRAYDIRGIYPSEINEKVAYLIGRAFVKLLSQRSKVKSQKSKVVVGRDNRFSSPSLFKFLIKGLLEEGAKVFDIGLSTSPMLYFSVAHFKFDPVTNSLIPRASRSISSTAKRQLVSNGVDGGIQITSSHLPKEWNGFKLVREKAIPISQKTGIEEIKNLVLSGDFKIKRRGKIFKKKVLREYLAFNLEDFNLKAIKPLKIVIDTANAVPGILMPEILKKTNCQIYHLFSKLDGSFPNHNPDPLIKENLKFLQREVKNKKANLGVAFDGDGDRIIFVDEKGEIISGDLITALVAKSILEEKPEQKILSDIRSSNIVGETIKKEKGIPIISRIGHSFIKEKMRKEDIIFAGELSGHYYFKKHYFCEAPIFVLLKILETISKTKKSLSDLIQPFKKYFHSGEINFKVKVKKEVLVQLEKKYKKGKISHLDGLRIDFKNWWFLVRPSQTEPVLRLVLEAKTKNLLEKKKKELINLIKT